MSRKILNKDTLRKLARFSSYFKRYKLLIIVGFFCLLLNLAFNIIQPLISRSIIDDALLKKNAPLLHLLGLIFLVLALVSYLVSSIRQYIFLYIQQKVILSLRKDLAEHIINLPLSFHNHQNPGYLMARVDSDVGNLAGVMTDRYIETMLDVLTLITISVIIFIINWKLTLLSFSLLPLFLYSLKYFGLKTRILSYESQESLAQVASSLQDFFYSNYIIKVFNRNKKELGNLVSRLIEFIRINLKMIRLNLVSNLTMGVIVTMAPLAVIWYGGYQVIKGDLSIGSLFAFNMYLAYFFNPLRKIYSTIISLQISIASLDRIFHIFDTDSPELSLKADKIKNIHLDGKIEFQDVSFSYQEENPVLKKISFKVPAGSVTAVVGLSGAGKTTIFNLMLGLYTGHKGKILFDETDINEYDIHFLRHVIKLVPQEPFLFNRTIYENIAFGSPDATENDILEAVKISNSEEFIDKLPNKINTVIGQRGTVLSGGEKQRISLARAILSNPRILLLDEATAFLDSETEARVQEAVNRAMFNRTCLIIAHRMSTIKNANQIIVMDKGMIIDSGSHSHLYRNCSLYKNLYDNQFNVKRGDI